MDVYHNALCVGGDDHKSVVLAAGELVEMAMAAHRRGDTAEVGQAGISIRITAPPPTRLATAMLPPCAAQMALAIDRPKPLPPL